MKKQLSLLVILMALTFSTFGQCPTMNCTSVATLPLSTNDWNNGQGIYATMGANRCVTGCGVFDFNQNMPNGWTSISFNGTAPTGIDEYQTINLNTGQRLFLSGINYLHHWSAAGGNDSTIIYAAPYSQTTAENPQNPNNSKNYVMLGEGATWYMGGIYYTAGMTYQGQGNNTNVVHFLACGVSTPLEITFEEFYLKNGWLHWKVNTDFPVHLEYASLGTPDFTSDSMNLGCRAYKQTDSVKASEGYYRLWVNWAISNIIPVHWQDIKQFNEPMGTGAAGTKVIELYRVNDIIATKRVRQ